MVDRQEIRVQIVGGGDTLDEAGPGLPSVRSNLVSAKPSAFNFSSIRCARRRLKTNSATSVHRSLINMNGYSNTYR
jgi:hypothetical protein